MQVGDAVKVTQGAFHERGCVGEVVEVVGEDVVVQVSKTKKIHTLVENLEVVSQLELRLRGVISQGK